MKRKVHVLLLTLTFTLTFISLLSSLGFAQDPEMTTKLVEGAKKESQLRWYHVLDVEEGEKLSKQFRENILLSRWSHFVLETKASSIGFLPKTRPKSIFLMWYRLWR